MTKRKAPWDKLKAGAPTKYKPEYCKQMLDYFSVTIFKSNSGFKKEYNYFPSFQGFAARELKVTHKTLLNWCKEFPEFLQAYNVCKELQEQILLDGGLTGSYNPIFTKFVMNSVSDTFKEKVEITADEETKGIVRLAYSLPAKKEG